MSGRDKILDDLQKWKQLSSSIKDDTEFTAMSDPTYRMQQTESVMAASIRLRSISQRVRAHAESLRDFEETEENEKRD